MDAELKARTNLINAFRENDNKLSHDKFDDLFTTIKVIDGKFTRTEYHVWPPMSFIAGWGGSDATYRYHLWVLQDMVFNNFVEHDYDKELYTLIAKQEFKASNGFRKIDPIINTESLKS